MRNDGTLNRRVVAATLLRDPDELLVVTGLGAPSYDAGAAGERPLNILLPGWPMPSRCGSIPTTMPWTAVGQALPWKRRLLPRSPA